MCYTYREQYCPKKGLGFWFFSTLTAVAAVDSSFKIDGLNNKLSLFDE
jgi:hypothetical protein